MTTAPPLILDGDIIAPRLPLHAASGPMASTLAGDGRHARLVDGTAKERRSEVLPRPERDTLGYLKGGSTVLEGTPPVSNHGFAVLLVAVAVAGFWFAGGHSLARLMIKPDAPVTIEIADLTSRVAEISDQHYILVEGEVVNTGPRAQKAHPVVVTLTDNEGRALSYHLGTRPQELAAGASVGFSLRIDMPASGVASLTAGFATVGQATD